MFYDLVLIIVKVLVSLIIVGFFFYIDYSILFKKNVMMFRSGLLGYTILLFIVLEIFIKVLMFGIVLSEVPVYIIALTILLIPLLFLHFIFERKSYYFYGLSKKDLQKATIKSLDKMKIKYKNYDYKDEIFLPEINNSIKVTRVFDSRLKVFLKNGKDIALFKDFVKKINKYCREDNLKPITGFYLWYFPIFAFFSVVYWLMVLL